MALEFQETTLMQQSGFGKTVPAQLSKTAVEGALLFGLPGPSSPQRSFFDTKVNWLQVALAVAAVMATAGAALLVLWMGGA